MPRWAVLAAHAVPLTVLPSGIWRILTVTFHMGGGAEQGSGALPDWLPVRLRVVPLSVFSEVLAFSVVGLVARWGEVFPRWIPGVAGRRVPPMPAVVPAAIGSAALTLTWTLAGIAEMRGDFPLSFDTLEGVAAIVAYAPLMRWGPLLGALTVHYARRRLSRAHRAAPPPARPGRPRA
ncbi:hypothetical protein [Phytomonospora endophytica]|uniref:Uncharacterized protein n=1 Tax=Phytomonospora endophytica TaxID=714109 RepID=A0A841FJT2_9ACTN|nr:hypothetical protein [Phytomonospora endophytica]MBB6033407.1 hypothetical protein [Phytomonospora endophytica]GIG70822.1 hypothetical protein Pen01_71170 [Phytomonospora endophytica]